MSWRLDLALVLCPTLSGGLRVGGASANRHSEPVEESLADPTQPAGRALSALVGAHQAS
jgi:hypothetical protein